MSEVQIEEPTFEWWETYDGVLEKFKEVVEENKRLKKENDRLKKDKPKKLTTKTK